MNNIAKAFVAAKREFAPALKTSTNPHFKSKYADLAGCLEAVNEALLNQGIALLQETSEDATGVTVETVFMHESGETIRGGKLHVPVTFQLVNKTRRVTVALLPMRVDTRLWRLAASRQRTTTVTRRHANTNTSWMQMCLTAT